MYILKYYVKSKYFTFKRVYYKEFNDYFKLADFVFDNNLPFGSYEIFEKIKEVDRLNNIPSNKNEQSNGIQKISLCYQVI